MKLGSASTLWQILLPVMILMTLGGIQIVAYETSYHLQQIDAQAKEHAHEIKRYIEATEGVIAERVLTSMRQLQQRSLKTGPAEIRGEAEVYNRTLPNLTFGGQPQTQKYDLVDGLAAEMGGQASLLVRSGDTFVTIASSLHSQGGNPAAIAQLDPSSEAAVALSKGKPFYGIVDLADKPYMAGYEPILNSQHDLIGAWYVGYPIDTSSLQPFVSDFRILDTGFAAVVDLHNNVLLHSSHIPEIEEERLLKTRPKDWLFVSEQIPAWKANVFIVYPLSEARSLGLKRALRQISFISLITLLLLILLIRQVRNLVYKPLGGDPAQVGELVQKISSGNLLEDHTNAESGTLISNIVHMRENLRSMMDELRRNAEELSLSSSVFAHANDAIFITDAQTVIVDTNPAFTDITQYSKHEALGKKPHELLSTLDATGTVEQILESVHQSGSWRGEIWLTRKDGTEFATWFNLFAVRNNNGPISHYAGIFSDITQSIEQQQKLERMAYHDPLTQLPNRSLFADRLKQALARAKRSGETVVVCYFDLDGFKPVNDTLGHEAGDQLLVELSNRLRKCLRAEDTVARMGGDEFAVLLTNMQSLEESSATLDRVMSEINEPFIISGVIAKVSASLGYTSYPHDEGEPDTLLRHADQAMYQAKLNGGRQYHLFDAEHDRQTRDERQKRERIESALPNGEFRIYYQPKVDMHRGNVIGVEALIRWEHPESGLLSPSEFLPIIENSSFCVLLGEWVIEEVLRQIRKWHKHGLNIQVSVNIAAKHMMQQNFAERLEVLLKKHPDVPSGLLELEITETAAIEDVGGVAKIIHQCRKLGVGFALDDFGVGYSSLTYLRRLPVEVVKIDQSFVRDMLQDSDDLAVVAGIISLSRDFKRKVIAEGVETPEHGLQLLRMGCEFAQGYGISSPLPAESIPNWVRHYKPDPSWTGTIPSLDINA